MTITIKVIRKGNTGYRKVYFSGIQIRERSKYARKMFSNKYDKRWGT